MGLKVAMGLLLALASAGALNWSYVAQHGQVAQLPPLALRRPVASLRLLFMNLRWLLAFAAGVVGWVLYVSALALAPLSLVQAVSAGGIGLLALLVWKMTGVDLSPRELTAVAIAVGGLVLLAVSLLGQRSVGSHGSLIAVAVWMSASLVAAAIAAGPAAPVLAGGAGLGMAAGILYAAGDVGTKAAVFGGRGFIFVPALLACHGLAFTALQFGFQRGSALATAGVATLFTNALPIAAGVVLYHERLPNGISGVSRGLAFAAVVAAAAALAHPGTVRPGPAIDESLRP
jgi:hypothetical protein